MKKYDGYMIDTLDMFDASWREKTFRDMMWFSCCRHYTFRCEKM